MFSAFQTFGKLGALASSVARAWSPLALWPDGVNSPGMWISPSTLPASFNDSTGTTPVATPGSVADSANPVGLALDIRAGATTVSDPGHHMLQATSAARPLESARVNKFVGTERYTNNPGSSNGWAGTVGAGTVTHDAMFVGAVALSQITISASTGYKGAYSNIALSPAFPFVVSGFAKADGYRYLQIYGAGSAVLGGLVFDAVAGVFSQNTSSFETNVTASGGGAFRFSVKSPGGVDSIGFGIIPQDTVTTAYGNQSWAGDGVSGMYLGGFSLVYGDQYTPYQSVPGNGSTYASTGITPFQIYDGTDDGMATASFAAGTLINGMDCMIAVRRDSGANCVAGLYNGIADATKFFGMAESASGSGCVGSGAGTPTVWVDNTQLTGGTAVTRGTLHTALTAGSYHILEFRGLDLSTWTASGFGLYTSYVFPGARGDIMLFESTASTEDKDKARQYLADKYGVTLP